MSQDTADFLVVGGGIIGVTVALELQRRNPSASVVLLEKEPACGTHASGRNSGVLHAGFYYAADSFKARFSRDGNRRLTEYCRDRGLKLNECGKLVVATCESDLAALDELKRRASLNCVELNEVTAAEARDLEPRANTVERALFSPTTSVVDPVQVTGALLADAVASGVSVRTGVAYLGRSVGAVRTTAGEISAGYVVNAAGLYADRIARDYGFAREVRILPFKGLYLVDAARAESVRRHIYPVPELKYPFLGVHFTVTADGKAKIGPTAIPALWREHYSGLGNFDLREFWETVSLELDLFARNSFQFRTLARREMEKYSKRRLTELAAGLVRGLKPASDWRWGPAGIRAQLVDLARRRLIMDFCIEGDGTSLHVLNAVSPAFTCSLPFADYLVGRIEKLAGGSVSPVPAARSSGS